GTFAMNGDHRVHRSRRPWRIRHESMPIPSQGRPFVAYSPRKGTVSVHRAGLQQGPEPGLVEDPHAELLRLGRLGPGVLADDDVVGALGHRNGCLSTAREVRL